MINLSSIDLQKKRKYLYSKIIQSANKVNRNINDIKVVAVTKYLPSPIWDVAFSNDFSIIGENKIQETQEKLIHCINRDKIELHMIGRLQRNKVKKAIEMFDIIQTVDSFKLANRINNISKEKMKKTKIFLQVNTSQDTLKQGFSTQEIIEESYHIAALNNIRICGIMTIPKNNLKKEKLRDIYKLTCEIRDKVYESGIKSCKSLSMGMSKDFEIAIEEGATHIRIGSSLFGVM